MTTAISTYVQNKFYILQDGAPRKAKSLDEYRKWHKQQPENIRTTKGIRVALSSDSDTIVSTVFLGEAHGFDDDNLPVLWETIVINNLFKDVMRYISEEDALMGHEAICDELLEEE